MEKHDTNYLKLAKKVLTHFKNRPELFNKELLKCVFWMQKNNEALMPLIDWLEEVQNIDTTKSKTYENK